MANAATVTRDVLNFSNGIAYEIALKYGTGKLVSNGRVMFSTVDGEIFFLDPDDADKIYALQLDKQEKFRLLKSRAGIEVQRIAERMVQTPAPAAVTNTSMVSTGAAPQAQNNSLSGIMAASYISAIDALLVASDYAEKHGVPFRITSGEVRSAAHCIYISLTKNGVSR